MSNQKKLNNETTRREFISRTAKGVLGTTFGSLLWQEGIHAHSNRQTSKIVERIAFGSCIHQDKPQTVWGTVLRNNPDLFLFLGDNIYGDTEDMSLLKEKYELLAAKPGFQRLLKTCPVLSTWDDHDYGQNDAGVEYPKKEESKQIFLDFFGVPENSSRRNRPGIYGAHIFGPRGKCVQIILLDTRYFKDTTGRKVNTLSDEEKKKRNIVGWYVPSGDPSSTLLGKDQWAWLEGQLNKEADLRIICSSVQVLAYEKGMESWGNYPHERKRLFNLIRKTKASGAMFISGDVHFSELSRSEEGPYPLYDFTCSGMTHSNKEWSQAINSFRVGQAYAGRNSGFIQIDWDQEDPAIHFKTLTVNEGIAIEHTIKKSELRI